MAQDVVIWGSGGHARELADLIEAINQDTRRLNLLGFVDDASSRHGQMILDDRSVLGGIDWLKAQTRRPSVVLGVGASAARARVAQRLAALNVEFPSLIHPSALVTRHSSLGIGAVVCAFAVVNNRASLGDHVHLNISSSVSHDCRVGSFCTLAPGARLTGTVTLAEGCDLGAACTVIPGRTVGEWTIVGAGAVVVDDVAPNATVVGVPARVVGERPSGWQREC